VRKTGLKLETRLNAAPAEDTRFTLAPQLPWISIGWKNIGKNAAKARFGRLNIV